MANEIQNLITNLGFPIVCVMRVLILLITLLKQNVMKTKKVKKNI